MAKSKSTSTNKTFSTGVTKRGTIDTGKYSNGGSTVLKSSSGSSYDFATGERGANNKYTADQVTQINGGTIDASKLGQSQITLPETPKTQNQNGTIAGANASLVNPGIGLTTDKNGLLVYNPVTPDATNATTPAVSNFQSYMNAIAGVEKPSATDTYDRLYKESGLKKASQDVQNYTSQINTIVAKSQADQLAVAGQGRGIPEPIIGGQQAQISKEAAIQALPLQALLANAQGNKELAQQHLDTAYKLEMQDAQSNYDYKLKVLDSVYNFATTQEKTKLEDVRRKEDQAFELKKMAIANQYDVNLKKIGVGTEVGADAPLYNGLNPATATAVRGQVSAFKSEPLVTNFQTIQEGRNFAQSISTNTTNPADDQALIYSLAKALDPGSVVREGEYATAQKYSQSWIKSYGKGIEQALAGTGFLSQTARQNIKKTIETKYESSKRSYDNVAKQYEEGINNLTGRDDGNKFIRSYITPDNTNQGSKVDITPEDNAVFNSIVTPSSNQSSLQIPSYALGVNGTPPGFNLFSFFK